MRSDGMMAIVAAEGVFSTDTRSLPRPGPVWDPRHRIERYDDQPRCKLRLPGQIHLNVES